MSLPRPCSWQLRLQSTASCCSSIFCCSLLLCCDNGTATAEHRWRGNAGAGGGNCLSTNAIMLLYFAEVQHARQIARLACTVSSSGLTSQTVKLQKSSNFCLSSLKACDGMFQTLASLALTCPPPSIIPPCCAAGSSMRLWSLGEDTSKLPDWHLHMFVTGCLKLRTVLPTSFYCKRNRLTSCTSVDDRYKSQA
jgi:hypothetical protein